MSNHSWTPLWPQLEPRILAVQPNGRLPRPNSKGWIGPIRSPLRAEAKPSFSVKPDSATDQGGFEDHGTGAKGSIADLADLMGIDPRVSIVTPPTALTLSTFCDQRKLDPAQLVQRWSVRQVQWRGRPALRYPTALGVDRIKYLDKGKDLEKYTWARQGGGRHWYGLTQALALPGPLYLVNGEPSVWACQQEDVAAVCLCGGEGAAPTPELVAELLDAGVTEVRVVYDRDDKGRTGAPRTVAALQAGGITATAFELPTELGDGGDVDDLHRWEGTRLGATLAALPELSEVQTQEPPQRRYLLEDEIDRLRPPTMLIKDVVPAGEVTMVIGPGDAGKTFLVVDMAKRVAQHYPVMYVAAEDASGIRIRKRAWELFYKLPRNGNFLMWDGVLPLWEILEVDAFIEEVRGLGLRMIVVDTLSQSIAGADENSSKDMTIVMDRCQRIAHETGAAVLVIHHTTKGGETYRGSSALKNNTYAFLEISRDDELIKFECGRIKNTRSFPARFFKLVDIETDIPDTEGKPLTSCVLLPADRVIRSDQLSPNELKMLEALALMTDAQGGAQTSELERTTGLSGNTFYRPLKRLRSLGLAEKDGKRAPLTITQEGRDRLATETANPEFHGANPYSSNSTPVFEVNTKLDSKLPNCHGSNLDGSTPGSSPMNGSYYQETASGFVAIDKETAITARKLPHTNGSNGSQTSYHSPPFKGRSGGSNPGTKDESISIQELANLEVVPLSDEEGIPQIEGMIRGADPAAGGFASRLENPESRAYWGNIVQKVWELASELAEQYPPKKLEHWCSEAFDMVLAGRTTLSSPPPVMTLTAEWQEIPEGFAVPPGADIRFDVGTWKNYARELPRKSESDVDHDRRRMNEVDACLARGDVKGARKAAGFIRGRKDRDQVEDTIAQAMAAEGKP